jgi:hypothetical protein
MAQAFFLQRPAVTPTIYVYNLPQVTTHKGYVKVGYTDRDAVTRINEQMQIDIDLDEEGGVIYLDYIIEIRGAQAERTQFTMEIRTADEADPLPRPEIMLKNLQ